MGTVQEPSRAFSSCHGVSSSAFAETTISLSENTKPVPQIVNQRELGVAVQVNQAGTVPNGIGKQVMAAKNLYDQDITRNGFTPSFQMTCTKEPAQEWIQALKSHFLSRY
jgi:hypothetical protein